MTKRKIIRRKGREREESFSDEDNAPKVCPHCKKNNAPYWTHNTVNCGIKKVAKRWSQNAKEPNALVQNEIKKALGKTISSKKSSGDSSDSEFSTDSIE